MSSEKPTPPEIIRDLRARIASLEATVDSLRTHLAMRDEDVQKQGLTIQSQNQRYREMTEQLDDCRGQLHEMDPRFPAP